MLDIIGVGDANVDLTVCVPHLPQRDEKVRSVPLGKFAGGVIANFCAAAATFGVKTGAVCKVGEDDYGRISLEDLRARGVDVSHMVIDPDCETYYCMVQLDDSGEKALTIVETSGFLPQPGEVDFQWLKTARRVHLSTLSMSLVEAVCDALAGTETKISLDIEPTAGSCSQELWLRLLPHIDIALPNAAGLARLTGCSDVEEGARWLLDRGVRMVVVTCGAEGARIYDAEGSFHYPAYHVKVVDTTGAGDCFNAVFLSCVVLGFEKRDCARYATAAAAISIGAAGSRTHLPTRRQVEEFMESEGGLC